jgi:hypothetical protein
MEQATGDAHGLFKRVIVQKQKGFRFQSSVIVSAWFCDTLTRTDSPVPV